MAGILLNQAIKPRYIPKNVKHEESIQKQVCSYLRLKYPNVIFRSDYASGLKLTQNQAVQHKRMQSSRAWPDIFIAHPSRGYHGLFIELKREGTTLYLKIGPRKGLLTSDPHIQEQALMLKSLNNLGYFARFGVGYDACINIIDWYLNEGYKQSANTELF